MKFGKSILAQQVPGWSQYYLDYKGLKKIVSSLTKEGEESDLALDVRSEDWNTAAVECSDLQYEQTLELLSAATGKDEDRSPRYHAAKAAFFFKLERELEKINQFYLQKEAELKLRLETLLSKRMAAASRIAPSASDSTPKDHVEWKAVEEGFRLLERDLTKLQRFIEVNATGFRKILKKWDKRSKSTTKELYLSRQVDVQPVFNRQLIAELSDIVTQCLIDLTDVTIGLGTGGSMVSDMILTHQIAFERQHRMSPYHDLETNLRNAIRVADENAIRELVHQSDAALSNPEGKIHGTRILWKIIIDAPTVLANLILNSLKTPFDFSFIDDINGRTCLHEAALSGKARLVEMCISNGVDVMKADLYGRTALHYAAMHGHAPVCRRLIEVGVPTSSLDVDNFTPLMHATLKGDVECVRILLEEGKASLGPPPAATDLTPLSLACRIGSVEVVHLLLLHGANNVPNTNGEYPIHIAAQEGHAEICCLLHGRDGWDAPDKYSEWTPLFHAARYGHVECVKELLRLGSNVSATDETSHEAVFYAAWYGQSDCVGLLLDAAAQITDKRSRTDRTTQSTPVAFSGGLTEGDLDMIPSLSLPPPIMPYRVYGHNFLDKSWLIHISFGLSLSARSRGVTAVDLNSRIRGSSTSQYPQAQASSIFKLVLTCKSDITTAPYSISIPTREERDCFTFQTVDIDNVSFEFSVCPNFGTRTIGRAVALSSMFRNSKDLSFVLPILDHHLVMIGELRFEARVVSPFQDAALKVGGTVDTYWKSLALPYNASVQQQPNQRNNPLRTLGSVQTSPSNHIVSGNGGQTITLSSLTGEYIYLSVQATRDSCPVLFDEWKLPLSGLDLSVSDLTLTQLKSIDVRTQGGLTALRQSLSTAPASEWRKSLSGSLMPLRDLLEVLPPNLGLFLDLAFPTPASRKRNSLTEASLSDVNDFVDSILREVYSDRPGRPRRKLVFGSFHPDVCSALNWKQPNYPVFLFSDCGVRGPSAPSHTSLGAEDVDDRRLSSISASVEWARANNLLGIFTDANLMTKIPSLVQGVKDNGLLLGVYGRREQTEVLSKMSSETTRVDAAYANGVITFLDYSP